MSNLSLTKRSICAGRILRVHHAGRRDRACQQLRAVAGTRLHIEHLHSRPRADKGQHLGRLTTLVGLPVRIAAVGRRDNGLIVRCPGGLRRRRHRSPCRARRNNGKHADRTRKKLNEQGHGEKPLWLPFNIAARGSGVRRHLALRHCCTSEGEPIQPSSFRGAPHDPPARHGLLGRSGQKVQLQCRQARG